MKILAIPATNSRNGLNATLLNYAAKLLTGGLIPDAEVEVLDLNDYEMPIYSEQRQAENGIPELARQFYDKLGAADAVLVSFAEHNGSYSAAWKNVYDWASRIDMAVYQGKKMAMFAASPGPRAGAGVLASATMTAPFFGADLVGSLGVGNFAQTVDPETGSIVDAGLQADFEKILLALAE